MDLDFPSERNQMLLVIFEDDLQSMQKALCFRVLLANVVLLVHKQGILSLEQLMSYLIFLILCIVQF